LLVECKADVMARTKSDGAGVIEWSRDRFGHHKIAAYLLSVGAMEPYELYKHLGSVSGSSVSGSGSESESESGSASASSLGSESESESESGSEESASGSSKSSGSNDAPKRSRRLEQSNVKRSRWKRRASASSAVQIYDLQFATMNGKK